MSMASSSSAAACSHSLTTFLSRRYHTRQLNTSSWASPCHDNLSSGSGSPRFLKVAKVLKTSGGSRSLTASAMRDCKASSITGDSWEELVLNNSAPVLVEFYASWCGSCKMVHRVVDEISQEYAGKIKCFVLNTDTDLHIAEGYDIKAVPVVVLFKDGKKHQSVFGTMPKEFYVEAINQLLQS